MTKTLCVWELVGSRAANVSVSLHRFHLYFQQLDSFQTDYFLWATAGGIEAAYERTGLGEVRMPKEWEAQGLADGEDEKAEEGDG